MKKNSTYFRLAQKLFPCQLERDGLIWKLMKLTLLQITLGMILSGVVIAHENYAQEVLNRKVSLKLEEVTLKRALNELETATKVKFVYSRNHLKLNEKVSMEAEGRKLGEILEELLAPRAIQYIVQEGNDYIVLTLDKDNEGTGSREENHKNWENGDFAVITGTVRDASTQLPLPAVNVIVKGTTNGTTTDAEGKFTINTDAENSILVFSFIGYASQEVPVNGRSVIDVALVEDVRSLEEVVVVGYGTQKKSDLTGSVGTIKAEKITERDNVNLSEALQGTVAGLQVHAGSGEPGRAPKVRVRGVNSINAGIDPMYVVDGITGVDPLMIDPNVIESVEVLKDASATAIYGARGSNGVILITTKRGIANRTEVTYKTNFSNSHMYRWLDLLNSEEYMNMYNQAMDNAAKFDPSGYASGKYQKADPANLPMLFDQNGKPRYDTDWQRETYGPKWSNTHSLMVRGGDQKTTYSLSAGYTNTNGIMIGNNYTRQNANMTIDTEALPWLHFGGTLMAVKSRNIIPGEGLKITRNTSEMLPMIPVKFPDGSWGTNAAFPNTEEQINPVDYAQNAKTTENNGEVRGDIFSRIQLAKSLEFRTSFSFNESNGKSNFYVSRRITGAANGFASVETGKTSYWQSESQFNWTGTLGENYKLTALVGMTWLNQQYEFVRVAGSGFLDDYYTWRNIPAANNIWKGGINGTTNGSSMNSYFSRLNLSFKEKYLLTLTGRYDGSSVFGKNNKYAFFPSVGFGWRISEEPFMSSLGDISNLKLRMSVGSVGNQSIGSYNSQRFLGVENVLFADGLALGLTQTSFGNPDLKWETTDQYDIGLELGLIDNRIQFEADVYYKKTKDMLFWRPIPRATGFSSVLENIGDMENKGLEIALTTHNINRSGFKWTTNINWAANRNKVLKLGANDEDIFPGPWFIGETSILRVGKPVGLFYGYTTLGTWSSDEAEAAAKYGLLPGDIKYADLNNDGVINDADNSIIGNGYPLWESNISNSFNYKNFDVSVSLRIVYGADVMNGTYHSSEEYQTLNNGYGTLRDAWTPENQDTKIAQVRAWGTPFQSHTASRWVEDGSFIRGQNLMVGYSLPQFLIQRVKIKNIRLYVSAQNLFLITPYSGYDPEAIGQRGWTAGGQLTQNFHFHQYPKPRTVRLGLNLSL